MKIRLLLNVFFASLLTLQLSTTAQAAVPFWGERQSLSVDTPAAQLKKGQWVWSPELSAEGPMLVIIELDAQLLYAYRNSVLIGYSSISSGKKGYETPTGVFSTLQKDRDHKSSLYNSAPMPYTQRLTWDGVALHAGGLPGYPSSHGCVHLPSEFAEKLFDASPMGMTVVVSPSAAISSMSHSLTSPLQADSSPAETNSTLSRDESYRWTPELQPEGPLSLIASLSDQRLIVLRGGKEIGRVRLDANALPQVQQTLAFVAQQGTAGLEWVGLALPSQSEPAVTVDLRQAAARLPADFLTRLKTELKPGTSLVITQASVLPTGQGEQLTLLTNQAPAN